MRTFLATVAKNRLNILRDQITSGNVGYINVQLTLDTDWTGKQIFPCYERNGRFYRATEPISGTTFNVDSALIASHGVLRLALMGVDGDVTITTNYVTIPIIQGAADGDAPPLPTPDSLVALRSAVDGKITEPATDGTSGQVLMTDGDGGRYWETVETESGTIDHAELTNRNAADQHPISAITGLEDALSARLEQVTTMPEASESLGGKIVQYIGATDETYTKGLFYICSGAFVAGRIEYSWQPCALEPLFGLTNNGLAPAAPRGITGYLRSNGVWTTPTLEEVGAAAARHEHDGTYIPVAEADTFAAADHNHDSAYIPVSSANSFAAADHNHDGVYMASARTNDFSLKTHNHDQLYLPLSASSGFAAADHNHDARYVLASRADQMMTSKLRITFDADFVGQAYTITGGDNENYTGVVPNTLIVEQAVRTLNAIYTVTCEAVDEISRVKTVEVVMYYGIYPLAFPAFHAYLNCTADAGATVTATSGGNTYTGTADSNGACSIDIGVSGTYAVTATLNGETTDPVSVEVTTSGDSYTCELPTLLLALVPFATGTDAEISDMLDAAKAGTIDLQTDGGWAVGDVRTIQIGAFTGGGNVAHVAQDIDIVITSFDDYNSCGAIMQFDFKDSLAAGNRMSASDTNIGGYGATEMYSTTLPALVNAIPTWLKDRLLEFSVLASAGGQSSTIETITGNKLALRSEVELFGATTYSKAGEGTQIPYYATSANRIKKRGHSGSANSWWGRSPFGGGGAPFCYVSSSGGASRDIASFAFGVAPFGCI